LEPEEPVLPFIGIDNSTGTGGVVFSGVFVLVFGSNSGGGAFLDPGILLFLPLPGILLGGPLGTRFLHNIVVIPLLTSPPFPPKCKFINLFKISVVTPERGISPKISSILFLASKSFIKDKLLTNLNISLLSCEFLVYCGIGTLHHSTNKSHIILSSVHLLPKYFSKNNSTALFGTTLPLGCVSPLDNLLFKDAKFSVLLEFSISQTSLSATCSNINLKSSGDILSLKFVFLSFSVYQLL
jgi:hypothetical protein